MHTPQFSKNTCARGIIGERDFSRVGPLTSNSLVLGQVLKEEEGNFALQWSHGNIRRYASSPKFRECKRDASKHPKIPTAPQTINYPASKVNSAENETLY